MNCVWLYQSSGIEFSYYMPRHKAWINLIMSASLYNLIKIPPVHLRKILSLYISNFKILYLKLISIILHNRDSCRFSCTHLYTYKPCRKSTVTRINWLKYFLHVVLILSASLGILSCIYVFYVFMHFWWERHAF